MNNQDLENLFILLDNEKKDFELSSPDNEILKIVLHNKTIDSIKDIVFRYSKNEFTQEAISSLKGE